MGRVRWLRSSSNRPARSVAGNPNADTRPAGDPGPRPAARVFGAIRRRTCGLSAFLRRSCGARPPEYSCPSQPLPSVTSPSSALPAPVRAPDESAFGEATGHLFLIAAPFAMLALLCVLFIREVPLRTTIQRTDETVAVPSSGYEAIVDDE